MESGERLDDGEFKTIMALAESQGGKVKYASKFNKVYLFIQFILNKCFCQKIS